jgi:hypothetical protein
MVSMKVSDQQIFDSYDDLRYAPAKVVDMGTRLVELRKTKGMWEVIEEVMKMWSDTNPKEYKSYLIDLQETKETGNVYSLTGGKSISNVSKDLNGSLLRHRLDIPVKVVYLIRRLYSADECPMDAEFYDEWSRRFPKTVVSEMK